MRSTLEEISIAYPESPLNCDLGGARGPSPGERMLDATVVRAADQATVTLAGLTETSIAWTLLLFAGDDDGAGAEMARLAAAAEGRFGERIAPWFVVAGQAALDGMTRLDRVLLDPLRPLHDRYGVGGPALYLFRPDAVVCARAPLSRWEDIVAHLQGILA
jgi:3-(3-hydroxy-phenyl)propionate hydroxylase